MMRIRQNLASLGPGWNPTIKWYALAVRQLRDVGISKRTSFRYLAAIHGHDIDAWTRTGIIRPNEALPSEAEIEEIWEQCDHGSWYFLPWHRGYLAAFEAILAKTIADAGGPQDWALPYWNYLSGTQADARQIPEVFRTPTMDDGSPNPLADSVRYGADTLGPFPGFPFDINLAAMSVRRFTSAPGAHGFGGSFSTAGRLESNPHNPVHVMVGGVTPPGSPQSYMFDPDHAGLDPIFWLHHCNIDRLWAAWLTVSTNVQESGDAWMDGPLDRVFRLPDTAGSLAPFTPADTLPGKPLAPNYDDLYDGTGVAAPLGDAVLSQGQAMPARMSSDPPPPAAILGANEAVVEVEPGGSSAYVTVLQADAVKATAGPQQLFLNLENIRGSAPSEVINVYVETEGQAGRRETMVEAVALFGLRTASRKAARHGGNGMTVSLDVTGLADQLLSGQGFSVRVETPKDAAPLTIERISLYRQPTE